MTWTPLNDVVISDDQHNSDVVDAIEAVRRIVGDLRVAYLDHSAVSVDADPEYRAAYFRFPHSADAGICIEVRHGDGPSYLKSPIGEYHGFVDVRLEGVPRLAGGTRQRSVSLPAARAAARS